MIICPSCNAENEDEYKFCLGCGSVLPKPEPAEAASQGPQMIPCPHCGTQVPDNFKFCGACGGAIAAKAKTPAETEPAKPAPQANFSADAEVAAAEAAELAGRLIVIRPDGTEGAEIALPAKAFTIGRESERKTLANDPFLSPQHATFEPVSGGFKVRDEDSLNGVFVRIEEKVELAHGDLIRMGQELLRFEVIAELDPVVEQAEPEVLLAGSPGEPYWARLCLIAGPDIVSRVFPIGPEGVSIGREIGNIIFNDDGFVSGRHARISLENGKAMLEDLGSSNGTFRRIRQEVQLRDGDLLLMGQQLFRLVVV